MAARSEECPEVIKNKVNSRCDSRGEKKRIWTISHFQLTKYKFDGFNTALLFSAQSLFVVGVLELCLKASDL